MTVDDGFASADLEALARRLLELLGRITGLESTYLTAIDWEHNTQHIVYSRNTGELTIPEGLTVDWSDTLCRRALEGGPSCTADVPSLYPDSDAARELGITTYVTFPVAIEHGDVIGTVCGVSARGVEVSDDALAVMETLADMVALQLVADASRRALAAANAELERMAFTDTLTGLCNRRALEQRLGLAIEAAATRGEQLGCIVFDIDRFKAINDEFGHGAGDEVLCAVAAHLAAHVRGDDVVARMGGDEFVVVLINSDPDAAAAVAERIRREIATTPIATAIGDVCATVSVGVASGPDRTSDELMSRADQALYAAKASGRNRVAAA